MQRFKQFVILFICIYATVEGTVTLFDEKGALIGTTEDSKTCKSLRETKQGKTVGFIETTNCATFFNDKQCKKSYLTIQAGEKVNVTEISQARFIHRYRACVMREESFEVELNRTRTATPKEGLIKMTIDHEECVNVPFNYQGQYNFIRTTACVRIFEVLGCYARSQRIEAGESRKLNPNKYEISSITSFRTCNPELFKSHGTIKYFRGNGTDSFFTDDVQDTCASVPSKAFGLFDIIWSEKCSIFYKEHDCNRGQAILVRPQEKLDFYNHDMFNTKCYRPCSAQEADEIRPGKAVIRFFEKDSYLHIHKSTLVSEFKVKDVKNCTKIYVDDRAKVEILIDNRAICLKIYADEECDIETQFYTVYSFRTVHPQAISFSKKARAFTLCNEYSAIENYTILPTSIDVKSSGNDIPQDSIGVVKLSTNVSGVTGKESVKRQVVHDATSTHSMTIETSGDMDMFTPANVIINTAFASFLSSDSKHLIMNSLDSLFRGKVNSEDNIFRFDSTKILNTNAMVEIQPCKTYNVTVNLESVSEIPIDYDLLVEVTGLFESKPAAAEILQSSMPIGIVYVSNLDEFTVQGKMSGKLYVSYTANPAVEVNQIKPGKCEGDKQICKVDKGLLRKN